MTARLEGRPWLTAPATIQVMDALEAAGGPDCARFVGGCIRNSLMDQPVDDIDIATRLLPADVIKAVEAAGLRAVPTGMEHGTVTAVAGGRGFEITTLRRDVSTDGRNATVAFTDDWQEDAARRDFRLNALYADRAGEIFDPTGQGLADALAGRVVFVGAPERRIEEDYLRILRFFRFYAWYGRGWPSAAAVEACAALAPGMIRLSAERVSKELLKLLAAPDPSTAVRTMGGAGVLAQVLPEAHSLEAFLPMVTLTTDPELRLSALLPPDPVVVEAAARRLRLSNALRERLVAAAGPPVSLEITEKEARALIYRLRARTFRDRVMRARAMADQAGGEGAGDLMALAHQWIPPRLPVGGAELAKLGVEPGPETGRLLKAFEDGWIADDFPTTGHEERLKALVSAPRG